MGDLNSTDVGRAGPLELIVASELAETIHPVADQLTGLTGFDKQIASVYFTNNQINDLHALRAHLTENGRDRVMNLICPGELPAVLPKDAEWEPESWRTRIVDAMVRLVETPESN